MIIQVFFLSLFLRETWEERRIFIIALRITIYSPSVSLYEICTSSLHAIGRTVCLYYITRKSFKSPLSSCSTAMHLTLIINVRAVLSLYSSGYVIMLWYLANYVWKHLVYMLEWIIEGEDEHSYQFIPFFTFFFIISFSIRSFIYNSVRKRALCFFFIYSL